MIFLILFISSIDDSCLNITSQGTHSFDLNVELFIVPGITNDVDFIYSYQPNSGNPKYFNVSDNFKLSDPDEFEPVQLDKLIIVTKNYYQDYYCLTRGQKNEQNIDFLFDTYNSGGNLVKTCLPFGNSDVNFTRQGFCLNDLSIYLSEKKLDPKGYNLNTYNHTSLQFNNEGEHEAIIFKLSPYGMYYGGQFEFCIIVDNVATNLQLRKYQYETGISTMTNEFDLNVPTGILSLDSIWIDTNPEEPIIFIAFSNNSGIYGLIWNCNNELVEREFKFDTDLNLYDIEIKILLIEDTPILIINKLDGGIYAIYENSTTPFIINEEPDIYNFDVSGRKNKSFGGLIYNKNNLPEVYTFKIIFVKEIFTNEIQDEDYSPNDEVNLIINNFEKQTINELSLFASGQPPWLSFTDFGNSTGKFSGTVPDNQCDDIFYITIEANDYCGNSNSTDFQINLINLNPIINEQIENKFYLTEEFIEILVNQDTFIDEGSLDFLAFQNPSEPLPTWLNFYDFGDNTGIFNGTTAEPSITEIKLTANDKCPLSSDMFFNIQVNLSNPSNLICNSSINNPGEINCYWDNLNYANWYYIEYNCSSCKPENQKENTIYTNFKFNELNNGLIYEDFFLTAFPNDFPNEELSSIRINETFNLKSYPFKPQDFECDGIFDGFQCSWDTLGTNLEWDYFLNIGFGWENLPQLYGVKGEQIFDFTHDIYDEIWGYETYNISYKICSSSICSLESQYFNVQTKIGKVHDVSSVIQDLNVILNWTQPDVLLFDHYNISWKLQDETNYENSTIHPNTSTGIVFDDLDTNKNYTVRIIACGNIDCIDYGLGDEHIEIIYSGCSPGTYQNGLNCDDCPIGTFNIYYSSDSIDDCTYCQKGKYGDEEGLSSCKSCPKGTFNTFLGKTDILDCINCSKGTYGEFEAATSSSDCTLCPSGTYNSFEGQSSENSCNKCNIAYYQPDKGSTTENDCIPCPKGTWSNESGLIDLDNCYNCDKGSYSEKLAATTINTCELCNIATYSDKEGSSSPFDCIPCPSGTYNELGGLTSSKDCLKCEKGKISENAGSTICSICLSGNQPNELQSKCELCPKGFISPNDGEEKCTICPPNFFSKEIGGTSCKECSELDICLGGNECDYGRDPEYYCSKCLDNFYLLNSSCKECPMKYQFLVVLGIIGFIIILAIVFRKKLTKFSKWSKNPIKGEVFIFLQLLGAILALTLNWPKALIGPFRIITSVVNLDISALAAPECYKNWSFYSKYLLMFILPLSIYVVLFIVWFILKKISPKASIKVIRYMSLGLKYLYIPMVLVCLQPFDFTYQEIDKEYTLDSDPTIIKSDSEYQKYYPLFIIGLLLYVVGIPLFFFIIVLLARKDGFSEWWEKRYGWVFKYYKPNRFWFELLLFLMKFIILATSLFFGLNSSTQGWIVLVILIIYISLYIFLRPHKGTYPKWVAEDKALIGMLLVLMSIVSLSIEEFSFIIFAIIYPVGFYIALIGIRDNLKKFQRGDFRKPEEKRLELEEIDLSTESIKQDDPDFLKIQNMELNEQINNLENEIENLKKQLLNSKFDADLDLPPIDDDLPPID